MKKRNLTIATVAFIAAALVISAVIIVAFVMPASSNTQQGAEASAQIQDTEIAEFSATVSQPSPMAESSVARQEQSAKPKLSATPNILPKGLREHPDIGRKVTNSFGRVYTVARVSRPGARRIDGVVVEDRPLFRHDSLNELDALFRTQPGTRIYSGFNEKEFDADLADALESGEVDEPLDGRTDEERRRIADVACGVEQLKAEIAEGRKASEAIRQTRKELAELADYRDAMLSAINDMKADGASYEEIEEAYASANKLFAEKGIPALLSPATARERLAAAKAAKAAKAKDAK